jgi:hypothetical protein
LDEHDPALMLSVGYTSRHAMWRRPHTGSVTQYRACAGVDDEELRELHRQDDEDDRAPEWPGTKPQATTETMRVSHVAAWASQLEFGASRRRRRSRRDAKELRSPSVDLHASTRAHRTIVET